MKKLLR